jgi:hypothetical protein
MVEGAIVLEAGAAGAAWGRLERNKKAMGCLPAMREAEQSVELDGLNRSAVRRIEHDRDHELLILETKAGDAVDNALTTGADEFVQIGAV